MLPIGFTEKMRRLLGAEFDEFFAAYALPRNTALRFQPQKGTPPALPFCRERVPWEENAFYLDAAARPGLHPYHDAGVFYLQEPSAMAPARLLDAQPGERVLDLCAAPGGKSTQLAAAMNGRGLLVCNEIHPKRARILSSNIERMGVSNALVLNEHPAKLAERFSAYFDRILVDAPCSGEGMFRKEDAAVSDWSGQTVAMCADRQLEILRSAAQMLRPGGRLVYSTCTFSPEENEGVISRFLHGAPEFRVEALSAPWFDRGRPEWIDDPAEGLEHTFRLMPHRLRGEGHFAAALTRTEGDACTDAPCESLLPLPTCADDFLRTQKLPLSGGCVLFGETVFLAPDALPPLRGLRVLRAGLELGEVRKGRFLPAHALALYLHSFPQELHLPAESRELAAYLRGETLHGTQTGQTLVFADEYAIGWARGADGVLKNQYPKGLRRMT